MIHILSPEGQRVTWARWQKMGGCGLSLTNQAFKGIHPKDHSTTTLGELQRRHILAGRELARFAITHLKKPEWTEIEYEDDPTSRTGLRRVGAEATAG